MLANLLHRLIWRLIRPNRVPRALAAARDAEVRRVALVRTMRLGLRSLQCAHVDVGARNVVNRRTAGFAQRQCSSRVRDSDITQAHDNARRVRRDRDRMVGSWSFHAASVAQWWLALNSSRALPSYRGSGYSKVESAVSQSTRSPCQTSRPRRSVISGASGYVRSALTSAGECASTTRC